MKSAEASAAEILDILQGGDGRYAGMPASLEHTMSLIRDLIVPVGYGGLYIHEADLDQVVATGAAQKFTQWEAAFASAGGVDAQVANDRIVIGNAGVYAVALHLGYEVSGNSRWTGHIFLDGAAPATPIDWERNVAAADRPGSVSCSGPLTIPAGGIIEAYIEHDQVGDITCTKLSAQLHVRRIG